MAKATGTAGRTATVPTAGGNLTGEDIVALASHEQIGNFKGDITEYMAGNATDDMIANLRRLGFVKRTGFGLTPAGQLVRGDSDMIAEARRIVQANARFRRSWAKVERELGR